MEKEILTFNDLPQVVAQLRDEENAAILASHKRKPNKADWHE